MKLNLEFLRTKKEEPKEIAEENLENFDIPEQKEIPQQNENIAQIFKFNPELEKIGSQEQYSEYLKTIFPESKIPNILWHAEKKPLENGEYDFSKSRGDKPAMWFSQMRTPRHYFGKENVIELYGEHEIPAKLNMKNPLVTGKTSERTIDGVSMCSMGVTKEQIPIFEKYNYDSMLSYILTEDDFKELTSEPKKWKYNEFVIFEPNQIHELGSKIDIEKFKKFIITQ